MAADNCWSSIEGFWLIGTVKYKSIYIHSHACVYTYIYNKYVYVSDWVESGFSFPGQIGHLGHVLHGSSGSGPDYRISGIDPDSLMNHVC